MEHSFLYDAIKKYTLKNKKEISCIVDYPDFIEQVNPDFEGQVLNWFDIKRCYFENCLPFKAKGYNKLNNIFSLLHSEGWVISALFERYIQDKSIENIADIKSYSEKLIFQWLSIIDQHEIDEVIFNHIPHHVDSYILYLVCNALKIKVNILYKFTHKGFRYCVINNIDDFTPRFLQDNVLKSKNNQALGEDYSNLDKPYSLPKYIDFGKTNYLGIKVDRKFNIFYRFYILFRNYSKLGFLSRRDSSATFFTNKTVYDPPPRNIFQLLTFFKRLFSVLALKREYLKLASKQNINGKKYILLVPNYQPEATSLPASKDFFSIQALINCLNSFIDDNTYILYKEHPSTFDYSLEAYFSKKKGFYKRLYKICNKIVFVDYRTSTYDLLKNAEFIVTHTSNVALESLRRGKPSVIFGHCWFENLKGVHFYQSIEELEKYLSNFKTDYTKYISELHEIEKLIERNTCQFFPQIEPSEKISDNISELLDNNQC